MTLPTPLGSSPSLLFHSTLSSYPSPSSSSYLATIRLSKPLCLSSIRLIPPSHDAFEFAPTADDGELSPSTSIDCFLNAKYPSSDVSPAGWKPNSLHKIVLEIPSGPLRRQSRLNAYEYPLDFPSDVTTSLVVLRTPFKLLTVSLYGWRPQPLDICPSPDWSLYSDLVRLPDQPAYISRLSLGLDPSLALVRQLQGSSICCGGDGNGRSQYAGFDACEGHGLNHDTSKDARGNHISDQKSLEDAPLATRLDLLLDRLESLARQLTTAVEDDTLPPDFSPCDATQQDSFSRIRDPNSVNITALVVMTLGHISDYLQSHHVRRSLPCNLSPHHLEIIVSSILLLLSSHLVRSSRDEWQSTIHLSTGLLLSLWTLPDASSDLAHLFRDGRGVFDFNVWMAALDVPSEDRVIHLDHDESQSIHDMATTLSERSTCLDDSLKSGLSIFPKSLLSLMIACTELSLMVEMMVELVEASGLHARFQHGCDSDDVNISTMDPSNISDLEIILELLTFWLEATPANQILILHHLTSSPAILRALTFLAAIPSNTLSRLASSLVHQILLSPTCASSVSLQDDNILCLFKSLDRSDWQIRAEIALWVAERTQEPGVFREILTRVAYDARGCLARDALRLYEIELWMRHFLVEALDDHQENDLPLELLVYVFELSVSTLLAAVEAHLSLPSYIYHQPDTILFEEEAQTLLSLVTVVSYQVAILSRYTPLSSSSTITSVSQSLSTATQALQDPLVRLVTFATAIHFPPTTRARLRLAVANLSCTFASVLRRLAEFGKTCPSPSTYLDEPISTELIGLAPNLAPQAQHLLSWSLRTLDLSLVSCFSPPPPEPQADALFLQADGVSILYPLSSSASFPRHVPSDVLTAYLLFPSPDASTAMTLSSNLASPDVNVVEPSLAEGVTPKSRSARLFNSSRLPSKVRITSCLPSASGLSHHFVLLDLTRFLSYLMQHIDEFSDVTTESLLDSGGALSRTSGTGNTELVIS